MIATARDLTEEVQLSRRLEAAEEENTRSRERLFRVFHVDPGLLREFIEDCESDLGFVNEQLKRDRDPGAWRSVLEAAFRTFHSLKGNATLLDLDFIAEDVHDVETQIERLLRRRRWTGNDFLPMVMGMTRISRSIAEVRELVARLLEFQSGFAPLDRNLSLEQLIRGKTEQIASSQERDVELDTVGLDPASLERMQREDRRLLRDVLIQFTRNSLRHGIESATERLAAGKPAVGRIAISLDKGDGAWILRFRDDGRGLDLAAIRRRAAASGLKVPEADADAARLIFEQGVSTALDPDLLAGRGVGMDTVREGLRAIGGTIQVDFEVGRFCEFTVAWPVRSEPTTRSQGGEA